MAAIPTRRPALAPPPPVLIASAAFAKGDREGSQQQRRLGQSWQLRSLGMYDAIGEIRYAWHFYSRMLMPLRIYPAFRRPGDRHDEIEEGLPVELLDRVQDPGGGRTNIARNYGRLMMGVGEGYLFGRNLSTNNEGEKWSFVWREELRFDDDGNVTHMVEPQGPNYEEFKVVDEPPTKELPQGSAVAYRMWTPHPRYSLWPDAPMKPVLDIAEELIWLSASVMATARSRLVRAPILKLPIELSPGSLEPTENPDDDPLNDPLLESIINHLEGVLDDPSAARALAPYLMWGNGEYLDKIDTLWLHDTKTDYMEKDLRKEALGRLGTGLDMPPEVIEGMIQGNHWSSWLVTEDMFRNHGRPIADQYVGDLAEAYLRPALKKEEFPNWQDVVVRYDASAVTVNPDRGKDAQAAWDRGAIGYKALRDAMDFEEEDEQTPEEHADWLIVKGRGRPEQQDPNRNTPAGEDPNPEGPPPGEPGATSERTNLPQAAVQLLAAAQVGLLRCRERAGAKLRTFKDTCPECLEPVDGIRNTAVAATLGEELLIRLGSPSATQLVRGGSDLFQETLVSWGYATEIAAAVGVVLEDFAARTLLDKKVPKVPAGLASFVQRAA